jgi:hypothetical protein
VTTRIKTDTPTKKGSISFLKKRNKKLLLFATSRRFQWANQVPPLIGKCFLVLFFKKDLLPSACLPFFGESLSTRAGMSLRVEDLAPRNALGRPEGLSSKRDQRGQSIKSTENGNTYRCAWLDVGEKRKAEAQALFHTAQIRI